MFSTARERESEINLELTRYLIFNAQPLKNSERAREREILSGLFFAAAAAATVGILISQVMPGSSEGLVPLVPVFIMY